MDSPLPLTLRRQLMNEWNEVIRNKLLSKVADNCIPVVEEDILREDNVGAAATADHQHQQKQ